MSQRPDAWTVAGWVLIGATLLMAFAANRPRTKK